MCVRFSGDTRISTSGTSTTGCSDSTTRWSLTRPPGSTISSGRQNCSAGTAQHKCTLLEYPAESRSAHCHCEESDDRHVPPTCWQEESLPPLCHCEESDDEAISAGLAAGYAISANNENP